MSKKLASMSMGSSELSALDGWMCRNFSVLTFIYEPTSGGAHLTFEGGLFVALWDRERCLLHSFVPVLLNEQKRLGVQVPCRRKFRDRGGRWSGPAILSESGE